MTLPWIRGIARPSTNNDDLSAQVEELTQEYRRLNSLVSGWTKSGGSDPYFDFLRARGGFFDSPILETAMVRRTSSQTIPDATNTAIVWEEITANTGLVSASTVTNSTRVNISAVSGQQNQLVWFCGFVEWNTVSTAGTRYLQLQTYRQDASSIGGFRFENSSNAPGAAGMSWIFPLRHNSSNAFVTVEVSQNSGGDLGISQARLAVLRTF